MGRRILSMFSSEKVWVYATTSVMPLISENVVMLNHWTKIVVVAKGRSNRTKAEKCLALQMAVDVYLGAGP